MLTQLDHILGSTSKVQLLRALLPLDSPVSGREAARLGRLRSKAGAQRALDELTDLNVFQHTQAGGTHLYEPNTAHHFYPMLRDLFDAERKSLSVARDELERALASSGCGPQVLTAVVFGSMARNAAGTKSDLDLLIITRRRASNASVEKALRSVAAPALRRRLGLVLSPYVLVKTDAEQRFKDGDPLMKAIVSDGRTLIGQSLQETIAAW